MNLIASYIFFLFFFFFILLESNFPQEIPYDIESNNTINIDYASLPKDIYVGNNNIFFIPQIIEYYISKKKYKNAALLLYSVKKFSCTQKRQKERQRQKIISVRLGYTECNQIKNSLLKKYQQLFYNTKQHPFSLIQENKRYVLKDMFFGFSFFFVEHTSIFFHQFQNQSTQENKSKKRSLYLYKWLTNNDIEKYKKNYKKEKKFTTLDNYIKDFYSTVDPFLNISSRDHNVLETKNKAYLEIFHYPDYTDIKQYQKIWQSRLPYLQDISFRFINSKNFTIQDSTSNQKWDIIQGNDKEKVVIISKSQTRGGCFILDQKNTQIKLY